MFGSTINKKRFFFRIVPIVQLQLKIVRFWERKRLQINFVDRYQVKVFPL